MEAAWHAVPTLARRSKRSKQSPKTSGHLIIFNYLFWSLDFPKYLEFQFWSLEGGHELISRTPRELDSSLTIWKSDFHALASQFAWQSWTLLHETSTSLSSGPVHLPCLCLPNVTELSLCNFIDNLSIAVLHAGFMAFFLGIAKSQSFCCISFQKSLRTQYNGCQPEQELGGPFFSFFNNRVY